MNMRRICVFGAGAIGGHLAAKLAAAGHQVSVVARGANLAAIRANGIALREGAHADARIIGGRVRASDRPSDLGAQDVVFVTTKATALDAFAAMAAPLIVAPERVIGAAVYSSNDVVEPGVVVNHTEGSNMLVVGETDDRPSERIAALRALLSAAGLHSPAASDIRQSVWDKLLLNFGSSLCVLLGEPISAIKEDPALRAVRARLLAEGEAIARAHGVALEGAPRRPGGAQSAGATAHKPSMLQDYERGRSMEVEAILAVPCAFARAAGVAAPTLEAVHAVTARLAARKGLYSSP